jgi:hypothetical protein
MEPDPWATARERLRVDPNAVLSELAELFLDP